MIYIVDNPVRFRALAAMLMKPIRTKNPLTEALLSEIADAIELVSMAESAYFRGDVAADTLQIQAEQRFATILARVAILSEAEADFVEPLFTELEERLIPVRFLHV